MMMMMIMTMISIRLKALIFCTGKDGTEADQFYHHYIMCPVYAFRNSF